MEIKNLFDTYEKKCGFWEKKICKVQKLRDEAAALETKAAEKRTQAENLSRKTGTRPDWKAEVVLPLAKELAKRKGLKPKVMGPMGLASRVIIALVEDLGENPSKQEHYRLTLQPDVQPGGKILLRYETGETEDSKYPKGSLGAMSGLDLVTAPLPDSIDEVEKLLVKYPAITQ